MSHPVDPSRDGADPSVGQLMTRLSEQTSRLVRDELLLARVELKDSVKHAGWQIGVLGTPGPVIRYCGSGDPVPDRV